MNTAQEVSPDEIESTRMLGARNKSELLRASKRITQAHAATCLGVHPSTISRTLEDLQRWSQLLACLGLQIAPVGSMVVDSEDLRSADLQQIAAQG